MRPLIVVLAVLAVACQREAMTTPDWEAPAPAAATRSAEAQAADVSAAAADDNRPPQAVFRTRPAAVGGVVAGGSSFDVVFNLCPSSDPDPGDELRFTFDFDGDGAVDALGHCRASHRYEVGVYESGCVSATACVSDRQPDHKVCRTFEVCAQGRGREPAAPAPTPEPTPTPAPQTFVEQTIAGDLTPVSSRDAWVFTAQPGTEVTLFVDTVSAESAYWMQACVSTSNQLRDCIRPVSQDRVACSYPPPGGLGCPRKVTVLPPVFRRTYYVIVGGFRFTESAGRYEATVRSAPGVGALGLSLDNAEHPASVEP